ncbi:MAG: hypothetical protein QGH25_01705 [Candidatus Latescibacteria bacterium]|nr:hypothetical protein [Candidatus Latescibacterota bacterium]
MALTPWIRIGQPLEAVVDDYERIFDAWDRGGIRGLVFGRLFFADDQGQFTVPAFQGDVAPYEKRGLRATRRDIALDADKEQRLRAMLADAKKRDWTVLIFAPSSGTIAAEGLPLAADPYGTQLHAATWEDIFTAFPEVDGGIMDGWTESPYELVYHHGNAVFRELTDAQRDQAAARGYDPARLDAGRRHLHARFQNFTPAEVDYYGDCGLLSELNLFDIDEDALYWLRWRRADGLREGRAFRTALDEFPRKVLLGNGPRSAVFSGMTALDFHAWDEIVDLLLVKHYFWHRGFDGMYGTVARWVHQVQAWNPALNERQCWTVVRAFLGIELPEVNSLADMELGFPQAFFDEVVQRETRRALAAVGDPQKILPWVDTGRMPHGGDPMTSGDLYRILEASETAGLQRFLFHNHAHLTAAEWAVIARMCGEPWDENPAGYWPPATPKPSTY